ncbi:MAG TPA: hypothetical protein VGB91_12025 [Rhizomicrobium sp.]
MARIDERRESIGINESGSVRAPYEKPVFHRIGADEAETGIQFGPEILILLS